MFPTWSCCLGGAHHPCPDEPHPLLGPDDLDLGVLRHVGLQLLRQVRHVGRVVHQQDLLQKVLGGPERSENMSVSVVINTINFQDICFYINVHLHS